jgi:parallel beta-helix repeat protein
VLRFGALTILAVEALAFVAGAAGAAPRRTLYVNRSAASCSNSSDSGSAARPFCTIGAAAAHASAGVTVRVAKGTYRGRVKLRASGTERRPIVFTAAPGAKVVITGGENGFSLSGTNWTRIIGFTITHTVQYGISVEDSSYVTISNNRVRYAGRPASGRAKYGIRLENVKHSLIAQNIVDHNTNSGIALVDGSRLNDITGNETFANAKRYARGAAGIHLYASHGNFVTRNISHDNEDSGIDLDRSVDNVVSNNLSYDNGDHGVDVTGGSARAHVLANSIYGNLTAGINVEGSSAGVTIANNISVQNGVGSPRTKSNIRVDSSSVPGSSLDYDIVSVEGDRAILLIWNSVSYTSLAALQKKGQEPHGIQADPRWEDSAEGDFHLKAGSPAIDSATSLVPSQPASDIDRTERTDDPDTPNTGAGPRLYDDRGAFEFRA